MAKPNFLLIGAPKSATTSLVSLLAQHPQVCIAKGKETHFFSHDSQFARGMGWYESLFAHGRSKPAIGDASTSYARLGVYPTTVERIVQHLPDARIIYSVRHPLDRIDSAYVEWMASPEPKSFPSVSDAVKQNASLIDASLYWKQISAYRACFLDQRIKIVFFEEFAADPDGVLTSLFKFLGVDASVRIAGAHVPQLTRASRIRAMRQQGNNTPINTRWTREARQWAIDQLGDDTQRFLEWCGKPADYWRINAEDNTR